MTRDAAIGVLDRVIAVPLTRTIRGIPTEVRLDCHDGVPEECAVSLDNLGVVPKGHLTERICTLSPDRLAQVCTALSLAVDCQDRVLGVCSSFVRYRRIRSSSSS